MSANLSLEIETPAKAALDRFQRVVFGFHGGVGGFSKWEFSVAAIGRI